jgi:photosystem II stability/assembly factor-like uncharacterized protein
MNQSIKTIKLLSLIVIIGLANSVTPSFGQTNDIVKEIVSSMKLRAIGPAVMGGRISHIEVDPKNKSIWYIAAGSGGVWKTTNAGVTFEPIFDEQKSYSIGTIAIDPNDTNIIWVGTGENISGRHVAWGDGIYKSTNAGRTWTNMGLERSEHIGRILIDPRDSNILFVAAEGPLWSSGGDRGVYKSIDGGKSWDAVLTVDENTGVTDIEFQPGNPDQLYAATYQRRRHVWGLMAGGPGSGIHKSTDNGETWQIITAGLPKSDKGKIGLAVTPADPNIVYATIEANDHDKGFYRSIDGGGSFDKRNDYISGGTGPHYYMEIEASPTNPDVVYQMDVWINVTRDGGTTFSQLESGASKHSDNHAMWIAPENSNHMIVGSDGGLYESFDDGAYFRHFPNLPLSQFYKVAMDNAEPFYNILGGAQDLGTLSGPSRTLTIEGVRNQDWYVPTGADGYGVAFDPDDETIQYMEFQQGVMFRLDKKTQETTSIKPQPSPNDPPERWNWDVPIVTSAHVKGRLYTGSQRVWRSDDRGNSWQPISGDLTRNMNRYTLGYEGRVRPLSDLHDNGAMSKYSTLSTVVESPVDGLVLYSGSDDGLINVSSDGGTVWTLAASLPNVPKDAFINDLEASQHDANAVFALADAHKNGDFKPYIFKSINKGRSWQSIAGDLPDGVIVWAIAEDHLNANLLFIGAENGIYVTINGGKNWNKLGGSPTIAFRDVKLHRRDNDVVGASFGRGFYILDDYNALRQLASNTLKNSVLPVRDAWWYIPNTPMQARGMPTLGSDSYRAKNPEFGAIIDLHMTNMPKTSKDVRLENETPLIEQGKDVPFPGYDVLHTEADETLPRLMVQISDTDGTPLRLIKTPTKNGLHRVAWDLRLPAPDAIDLREGGFRSPFSSIPEGPLVAPGRYQAQLVLLNGDTINTLGDVQPFNVKSVLNGPLGTDYALTVKFHQQTSEARRWANLMREKINRAEDLLRHMKVAAIEAPRVNPTVYARLDVLSVSINALNTDLNGDRIRRDLNEPTLPSILNHLSNASNAASTREAPTQTQRSEFELAQAGLKSAEQRLSDLLVDLTALENELELAGAPSWR